MEPQRRAKRTTLLLLMLCPALLGSTFEEMEVIVAGADLESARTLPRDGSRAALTRLWSGTREERVAEAESAGRLISSRPGDGPGEPTIPEVAESLRLLLIAGGDEWVLDRLARSLSGLGAEVLVPFFREALDHPSPSVRLRAMRHFIQHPRGSEVEKLENLWSTESRSWVLKDLMRALTMAGSRSHARDCLKLMKSEDRELAAAAVIEVGALRSPGALRALAERARNAPMAVREQALRQLATGWPDSSEAEDAVVEASHSPDSDMQQVAVAHLAPLQGDRASRRLAEVLRDRRNHPQVRLTAVEAAAGNVAPWLIDAQRSLLAEPDEPLNESAKFVAWENLAVLGLQDGESNPHHYGASFRLGSWPFYVRADGRDSGLRSIRCWAAPEGVGESKLHARIASGSLLGIQDHFELDGRLWVEVGHARQTCWVPRDRLVDADLPFPPSPDSALATLEFDAPWEELDGDHARRLSDAGLLQWVDPAKEVVGLVLEVDPREREQLVLLVEDAASVDTYLGEAVRFLLMSLASSYRDDPELMRAVDELRAPWRL